MNVDPMAEMYPSWTPYNYVANNPLQVIDLNGECWNRMQDGSISWESTICDADAAHKAGTTFLGSEIYYEANDGNWYHGNSAGKSSIEHHRPSTVWSDNGKTLGLVTEFWGNHSVAATQAARNSDNLAKGFLATALSIPALALASYYASMGMTYAYYNPSSVSTAGNALVDAMAGDAALPLAGGAGVAIASQADEVVEAVVKNVDDGVALSAQADEVVDLYRNFGMNEYQSIVDSGGKFSIHPHQYDGKQFWIGTEGLNFWIGTSFVKQVTAKVTIPKSYVTPGNPNYIFVEKIPVIDSYPGGTVNKAMLNKFNNAMKIEWLMYPATKIK